MEDESQAQQKADTAEEVELLHRRDFLQSLKKWSVTVGQPPSTEIGVTNMPSLKAKKLGKLPREKVLLEL